MLGNLTVNFLMKIVHSYNISEALSEYTAEQRATIVVKIQSLLVDVVEHDNDIDCYNSHSCN